MADERKGQESETSYVTVHSNDSSPSDEGLRERALSPALTAHLVSPASLFENPAPLPPPPPKEKKRYCNFRWQWEMWSLFVSLMAFISIFIILSVYNDRALSDWKGPITINAVIAVLSAIFKGFLILPLCRGIAQLKWVSFANSEQSFANLDTYDQASRGAWGAFVLLKRQFTGDRLSPIAILGAIIAILMLITEPFSQAAANIAMCERVDVGKASIPRFSSFAESQRVMQVWWEMTQGFQLAAYQGLYDTQKNTSVLMEPHINCATGNCTFSQPTSLQTLSMCYSCRDVTSKVVFNRNATLDNTSTIVGYSNFSVGSNNGQSLAPIATNCTTPVTMLLQPGTASWPEGKWFQTSIADFQGIATSFKDPKCDPGPQCAVDYLGFDCALRPCVQSFSSSVVNGKYTETLLKTEYMHVSYSNTFVVAVEEAFVNGTWTKCTSSNENSTTHNIPVEQPFKIYPNGTRDGPETVENLWYPTECVYAIGSGDHWALRRFLNDIFSQGALSWGYDGHAIQGDPWLKSLFNTGAPSMDIVNKFAENLANSLGTYIRTNGISKSYELDGDKYKEVPYPAARIQATGDMKHLEACIQARWRFLSFLGVLFVLEIVFFVAVLWVDHRSRLWQADWKAATLPMMFQALQDRPKGSGDKMERDTFYNEARALRVRLVEGEKGWVFASGRDN